MNNWQIVIAVILGTFFPISSALSSPLAKDASSGFSELRQELLTKPSQAGTWTRNLFRPEWKNSEPSDAEARSVLAVAQPLIGDFNPKDLPSRFSWAYANENQVLQKAIDHVFARLFQTSNGNDICRLAGGKSQVLEKFFGLSDRAATSFATICPSGDAQPPDHLLRRGKKRRYLVIVTPDEATLKTDSWTTRGNMTILFFSSKDFTFESFAQRLIHETAIFFDAKDSIGSAWLDSFVAELISYRGDSCRLYSAAAHPLIKYSLSTIRAMRTETVLMREMGLTVAQPIFNRIAENLTCADALGEIIPRVHAAREFFANDSYYYASSGSDSLCSPGTRPRNTTPLSLAEAFEVLNTEKFILANGGKTNVCSFLMEPMLSYGPYFFGKQGPRPRIGGGWDEFGSADAKFKAGTLEAFKRLEMDQRDRQGKKRLDTFDFDLRNANRAIENNLKKMLGNPAEMRK